jgi:hypothetical protein
MGRPPIKEGAEVVTVTMKMTVEQREKLRRLGGASWVRSKIDRAKEPDDGA